MVDVDDFKTYNDTFGHMIGDIVLRELGMLIHKGIRQSDIAFRYGGDEFAILLPESNEQMAAAVAGRLIVTLEKHSFATAKKLTTGQVTISCGVAAYTNNSHDFVTQADKLLLRAKNEGKACVLGG